MHIYLYIHCFFIITLLFFIAIHYITLHDMTLHYITLHYITLHYYIIIFILYLFMSEWIVMTPWCFSHVRQFRKGILSNCIKLGEMQCLHRCWPFGRDVTNSFQPSCEQIVPAIFQGPKRYIFYVHPLPRLLRSKPDICGPFKSIFFLFSTQKKTSDVCSDQIGGEKNPGLSQFIAQEVLSLLPRKFSVYCVV